jgi:prolyl-tRNA synthetase
VGHIFYLGTKYSQAMEAQFLGEDGQLKPIEMGCYGIGIGRSIQAVIEQSHDKDGIIWPQSVAPFHVHVCMLDPEDPQVQQWVETLEKELSAKGYDVFVDDRAERPGVKFKDADLLGFPLRVNLGARGLGQSEVEIVERKSKEMVKVNPQDLVSALLKKLGEAE